MALTYQVIFHDVDGVIPTMKKFEGELKRELRHSTKVLAEYGMKELQKIFVKYEYQTLLNSIVIQEASQYRTLLIVDAPFAMAIDTGNMNLAPDIVSLPLVNTKYGLRRMWEGEEAMNWKSKHFPNSKSKVVFVGESGGADRTQGIPYPEGVHFSDAATERIEREVEKQVLRTLKDVKNRLFK